VALQHARRLAGRERLYLLGAQCSDGENRRLVLPVRCVGTETFDGQLAI